MFYFYKLSNEFLADTSTLISYKNLARSNIKINKIAILWESETGGGVSSYLKYLLQSKAFRKKKIIIFWMGYIKVIKK